MITQHFVSKKNIEPDQTEKQGSQKSARWAHQMPQNPVCTFKVAIVIPEQSLISEPDPCNLTEPTPLSALIPFE